MMILTKQSKGKGIHILVQEHGCKMNPRRNVSKECHTRAKMAKKSVQRLWVSLKILSASLNSRLPSHYRRAAALDISEALGNEHMSIIW